MKKIVAICLIALTLFSCSSDDNTPETAKTLHKIVYYQDSQNQRQWNFSNGLLTTITYADGSLAEEFTYDALNRVIKDVKFANGIPTETNTIAYNADNTIKAVNSLPYTYNAATRTYAYSYGSNFTIDCKVNEDMLAVDFVRTGVNPGEYHMTYDNGKMTSFEKRSNGTTNVLKNFDFGTVNTTDLYNVVLAVAKVKSLTDPSFFIDCPASKVNPEGFDKGPSDPFYYNYGVITNMDGSLMNVGIEVLDQNNNAVSFYSFADYYYQ